MSETEVVNTEQVAEPIPDPPDHNVQIVPHFGPAGITGVTLRLQPVRNEVIDKVLAVLNDEAHWEVLGDEVCGYDSLKSKIEALRGVDRAVENKPEVLIRK